MKTSSLGRTARPCAAVDRYQAIDFDEPHRKSVRNTAPKCARQSRMPRPSHGLPANCADPSTQDPLPFALPLLYVLVQLTYTLVTTPPLILVSSTVISLDAFSASPGHATETYPGTTLAICTPTGPSLSPAAQGRGPCTTSTNAACNRCNTVCNTVECSATLLCCSRLHAKCECMDACLRFWKRTSHLPVHLPARSCTAGKRETHARELLPVDAPCGVHRA